MQRNRIIRAMSEYYTRIYCQGVASRNARSISVNHEQRIQKSTWKNLATKLNDIISNSDPISVEIFFTQHNIMHEDLIYSFNGRFASEFQKNIFRLYCLRAEFSKAIGFLQKLSHLGNTRTIIYHCVDNQSSYSSQLKQSAEWQHFIRQYKFSYPDYDNRDSFIVWPFILVNISPIKSNNHKCFFSRNGLQSGESVYKANWFAEAQQDDNIYFLPEYSKKNERLKQSIEKYNTNSYTLNEFTQNHFDLPWINKLIAESRFTFDNILELIVNGYQAPSPYEWVDLYEHYHHRIQKEQSPRLVYEGMGMQYLQLLWILIKCGYEDNLIEKIESYPLAYAVTLLAFDKSDFHQHVIDKLSIPGLKEIYALTRKRSLTLKDLKTLHTFSQQHPEFIDALSLSLQRYEYHLYAMYDRSPVGGCQWLQHLRGKMGSQFYLFFLDAPEKLPILKECLTRKQIPDGISKGGEMAYAGANNLYAAILYHLALTHSDDYTYWRDSHQIWRYCKGESVVERIIKNAEKLAG